MIHLFVVLVSLSLLFGFAFSQSVSKDVVYLKNGSVIKGEIIEQIPNKSIKIQTSDGNVFVYDLSDIEKIAKEKVSAGDVQKTVEQDVPKGFHTHDGFYLSLTGGPAFGAITWDATNFAFKKLEMSGTGFQFDFKIGGVISEEADIILSFDVIARAISAPTITVDGTSGSTTSDISVGDAMYGIGLTKYFMTTNIYISATVGMGRFTMTTSGTNSNSESGFAFQVKVGKEWWVSDNWGLGVAAGLGSLSADDQKEGLNPAYSGKLSTTKFFVVFNTTFN
jgi:hypothetical protein